MSLRRTRGLSDDQRDDFEDILRGLTTQRQRIRDAMCFAIDNSEAANEIVQIMIEALTLCETPIPTKVARLFLVSDILHNSTAPVRNAHAYRSLYALLLSLLVLISPVACVFTLKGFKRSCLLSLRASATPFVMHQDE